MANSKESCNRWFQVSLAKPNTWILRTCRANRGTAPPDTGPGCGRYVLTIGFGDSSWVGFGTEGISDSDTR